MMNNDKKLKELDAKIKEFEEEELKVFFNKYLKALDDFI